MKYFAFSELKTCLNLRAIVNKTPVIKCIENNISIEYL